ncbi:hypothetical protein B0H14DRAFT_2927535 [Mycena olivaceomarginata]|nr:hypothetical protein B0H14DRAFT_2927535 [Mycena olivaceomarginata]
MTYGIAVLIDDLAKSCVEFTSFLCSSHSLTSTAPLKGSHYPTTPTSFADQNTMDDCCGLCCICISCFGLVAAAFRYLPFQSVCRCGRRKDEDEEDFDTMKFPEHDATFTPDGERIRPYAPMEMQPPSRRGPPPNYPAAVRDAIRSDDEQPMGYRPEQDTRTQSQIDPSGRGQ